MERKEAIKILVNYGEHNIIARTKVGIAFDMAIKTLETDAIPREYIEQMIAEIEELEPGYNFEGFYYCQKGVLDIIHKYTKEKNNEP